MLRYNGVASRDIGKERMSRRRKDPLRTLSADERSELARLSRSRHAPAAQVARATALLAVADGRSYLTAARRAGRRDGDTVAAWVARFNREGLAAVGAAPGGGAPGPDAQTRGGGAPRSATPSRSGGASSPRPRGCRTGSATARRRGAWARCAGPCATPRTGCPRSAPTRSGAPCARPAWAGSAAGPGASPARWYADAGTAAPSRSPTTMPPRKKLIERAY